MKILIIGSDYKWSIERFFVSHFKELDCEVKVFPAQNLFFDYYYNSNFQKVLFKLGISSIVKKINNHAIDFVDKFSPDIIWIFKGMEILPQTLVFWRSKGIKLVNYNPDNPFIFSDRGSGNLNITNSINLYDCHFTYNLEIKNVLEVKHKVRTVLLPFACDVSQILYNECANEIEILKVCFLGNPDKTRASFIQQLADNGIEIDVYGNDWSKFINHKNITLHPPVYGIEQWKVLRKYRVQINLMRIHNLDSHNMRSFEIPGIGGIQVAPFTDEHAGFFIDNQEIFLFHDIDDCVKKIDYLLTLSIAEAQQLRMNARNVVINKKHTYKDRSEHVISVLRSL